LPRQPKLGGFPPVGFWTTNPEKLTFKQASIIRRRLARRYSSCGFYWPSKPIVVYLQ